MFLGVGIGNPIFFFDFFLIFYRKQQWGTRGESGILGGGGKPDIKQIVKKKIGEKSEKAAKSKKNNKIGKIGFFFTENGLKCIIGTPRNTFKCQKSVKKKHKIGEKSDFSDLT